MRSDPRKDFNLDMDRYPSWSFSCNPLRWIDGHKTHIAALLAACVAANHVLEIVPDKWEQAILAFAMALGYYGIRSAIAKGK